jgi:multiple sugar transport system ATP-binding protein
MRIEIARMKERLGTTMIYVTHDQIEAMTLADKIVVLNSGRVEQIGSPLDLYNSPVNRFVAGFIGSPKMNFLAVGERSGDSYALPGGEIALRAGLDGAAVIGIRPEHLEIVEPGTAGALRGTLTMTEHLGSDTYAYVALPGTEELLVVRLSGERALKANQPVGVGFDPAMAHVFAQDGRSLASARPVALEAA